MSSISESKETIVIKKHEPIGVQDGSVIPGEMPVLAVIEMQGDLGRSEWQEVVYHDGDNWQSFAGSTTFSKGERVLKWIYATECF